MIALSYQRKSPGDNQTTRSFLQQLEAKNQAESSRVFSSEVLPVSSRRLNDLNGA
jgi:hypothetical protein